MTDAAARLAEDIANQHHEIWSPRDERLGCGECDGEPADAEAMDALRAALNDITKETD
jgi:hypothetical protein